MATRQITEITGINGKKFVVELAGDQYNPRIAGVLHIPQEGATQAEYYDALEQVFGLGPRRIVVDVSRVNNPAEKLTFRYATPGFPNRPLDSLIYISGIRPEDTGASANERFAKSFLTSPGIIPDLETAIRAALR
ncbi:hypothetical protein HYY72_01470 [Candidatus Woesearchaeota archaeon]|nr:hypothetical protein [Candidatus Woesearchaeota archaeon]